MKRLILFVSLFLVVGFTPAKPFEFKETEQDRAFQFAFAGGRWLPAINPLQVGAQNYTTLENMRYTDGGGLETVEGYDNINTTITSGTEISGFHFYKGSESHVITKVNDSGYKLIQNTTAIPSAGDYSATALTATLFGTLVPDSGTSYFSEGPAGTMLYADPANTWIYGGNEIAPAVVLMTNSNVLPTAGGTDVTEICRKGLSSEDFTWDTSTNSHLWIGTPFKISAVKFYISGANAEAATTLSMTVWRDQGTTGAQTITDGTAVTGVPLAQTGTVTVTGYFDPGVLFANGVTMYWYSFYVGSGAIDADIYKISVTAPLQNVPDVWNGVERTCTGFQVYKSSSYEDYTYQVNTPSTVSAPFAAEIGGVATTDYIYLMFDERMTGFNVTMLEDAVNAVTAEISEVAYWTGLAYASVGTIYDGTERTTGVSFSKSGTVSWMAPAITSEQPKHEFGKFGYVYRLTLDGTLTAGTSVDTLYGITAPLKMTGYENVGFYNNRAMLIRDNRVDYSLPNAPWIYNGVNTSDNGINSLYFGDENDITATSSLYNRYGSNIIESWVVTKKSQTFLLTGSQPYADYNEPFVIRTISSNIGCPAPMTMKQVEIDEEGSKVNALIWLDSTGPVLFDGATITRIPGIENYFELANTECVTHASISAATAYVDHTNQEYNLIFPNQSQAYNTVWLVFNLKQKKWYEKVPSSVPVYTIQTVDTNGHKYNYGHLSSGYLMRLDYSQTWNGTGIDGYIVTGEFMPPVKDELGLWGYYKLTGLKLVSEKTTEDVDVTVTPYLDGSATSQTITVALDAGLAAPVSRNRLNTKSLDLNGYVFQFIFETTTASEKWQPLAWGYKARLIRED